MAEETFFNINQFLIISGCTLLVVLFTSLLHHWKKKITRWWHPKWGSLFFSVVFGTISQLQLINVIEPFHILMIIGNITLIYLAAAGFNAVIGKPVEVICEYLEIKTRGESEEKEPVSLIYTSHETWRSHWFD